MIDDNAEYDARRQIRAQADADVAAFIESLGQDEETGVPPPVKIKITDVSTQPVKFSPFDFGQEGAGTTPSGSGGGPPGENLWACCVPDDNCSEMSSGDCETAGGTWFPGQTCADNPCDGACCDGDSCVDLEEVDCAFDFKGIGTSCDDIPDPCGAPPCNGCGFVGLIDTATQFLTVTITYDNQCIDCTGPDGGCREVSCTDIHSLDSECVETIDGDCTALGLVVGYPPLPWIAATIDSNTSAHWHSTHHSPECGGTEILFTDATVTLSNECTP